MKVPREVKELFKTRNLKETKVEEKDGIFDILASDLETSKDFLVRVVLETKFKSDKVSIDQVRKMKKALEDTKLNLGILIGKGLTSSGRKGLEESTIEWINLDSLRPFSIFDHFLVPKHEVLPEKETEKLLKKYHINKYQLPLVKFSDPPVKAIGGKVGDIIKITRDSPTAGEIIVYRYVVK